MFRAENSKPWPGDASVRYSAVHLFKGDYRGTHVLDGKEVADINSSLVSSHGVSQAPKSLKDEWGTSYVGCAI